MAAPLGRQFPYTYPAIDTSYAFNFGKVNTESTLPRLKVRPKNMNASAMGYEDTRTNVGLSGAFGGRGSNQRVLRAWAEHV